MSAAVPTGRPVDGVFVPNAVLHNFRRSHSSPLWLRAWAIAALTADGSGRASFGATEFAPMLRRKNDKHDPTIEQVDSAMNRAQSLGLIGDHVGTTSFTLGRGVTGVEASAVR